MIDLIEAAATMALGLVIIVGMIWAVIVTDGENR